MKKTYWDLTKRPHTQLKLAIYEKYLYSWCTIFAKQKYYDEIYIIDCFAGRGSYIKNGEIELGSPLIAAKIASEIQAKFDSNSNKPKPQFKIKCRFIEKKKSYFNELTKRVAPFSRNLDIRIINGDFNNEIIPLLDEIKYKPSLFFIDPSGIKSIKKVSIEYIVKNPGAKDILLNYMQEGVSRIGGLAKRVLEDNSKKVTARDIKTIKSLFDFIGKECLSLIDKHELEILKYYVENIIKSNNKNVEEKDRLDCIAFNMPYPHKRDTIYYLLFASRNKNAIKIVKQVYAKGKSEEFDGRMSLFSSKELARLHKDFSV